MSTVDIPPGPVANIEHVKRGKELVLEQLRRRIIGQDAVVRELMTAFFAGGHCLLVGVPGLAKTLLVRSFADALGMKFNRIQFTPDLMPSDVIGTDIISGNDAPGDRGFNFLSGPIFANVLLADEINRTPPKTQSALLEAMEEFQVTVAGKKYSLPEPFFVMATQNPIEQEGTYALPIAALDRFIFNVVVDYPAQEEELDMLFATTSRAEARIDQVLERADVLAMLRAVRAVEISDEVMGYATSIVRASRPSQTELPWVRDMSEVGASPRGVQALILGAKANAALDGREEALASDVRMVALPALRHRVVPSFHAAADGHEAEEIIRHILAHVPRPAGDEMDAPAPRRRRGLFGWLLGEPRPRSRV